MSESGERLGVARLGFEKDGEAGLTLVELLVVLLIVGVLLAVVIPPRLAPVRAAQRSAHANLLYTNGHGSPLGVCSDKTGSTITAVDEGLSLVSSASSTKLTRIATTSGKAAGPPASTGCGPTVGQNPAQVTGADVAGIATSRPGSCPRVVGRMTGGRCSAVSTVAGSRFSSVQST